MAWKIVLEDENGGEIQSAGNELVLGLDGEGAVDISGDLTVLKYLDPYGNLQLNRLQMDDLERDLNTARAKGLGSSDLVVAGEIIALANRCKNEPHTYLTFYGN